MILEIRKFVERAFVPRGNELPDAYIIGAQKAGTSSLYYYLRQHMDVACSLNKEVHFFDHKHRYDRGIDWYKSQFPRRKGRSVILEATPRYLYIKKVPELVANLNKPAKFIVMIREPIARSYSAWNMYRQFFKSPVYIGKMRDNLKTGQFIKTFFDNGNLPDYNTLVKRELEYMEETDFDYEPSIVKRGLYKDQIENWLRFFEREDFFFIQMEELKKKDNLERILSKLFEFLSLKEHKDYFSSLKTETRNKRDYAEPLDAVITDETRSMLQTFYDSQNKGLDNLIGQDIKWLSGS